jgi:tRNA (cmo5U34)-methyltransferase
MEKSQKSSVEQIRQRFDNDVERFSNLEVGHTATIDSAMTLELVTRAAAGSCPQATRVLDIGCGAGNYTLKLLQLLPDLDVSLVDLSGPMLTRAIQRIGEVSSGEIHPHQADIRALELGENQFDIIMAAAVFHHLREEGEWRAVFSKCFHALKPGGGLWIFDMIEHSTPAIQALMRQRYSDYLVQFKNEAYRDQVFGYIEQEDTPRPLMFQLDLLREAGFTKLEILHKTSVFAAFGAIK